MKEYIHREATALARRAGSRDPFAIAAYLGVICMDRDDFTRCKGMYRAMYRQRFIILNARLPWRLRRIVCAHELGHDLLHREQAAFQDFALYNMRDKTELEANLAAAAMLLEDDAVYALAREGLGVSQIAASLDTDIDLLRIKLRDMRGRGYALNISDYGRSGFLRG